MAEEKQRRTLKANPEQLDIRVGPLVITIHADDEYVVCEPDASIASHKQQGYFASDTRLVSDYKVMLSKTVPILMNSSAIQPFSSRFEFINAKMHTAAGKLIKEGSVHMRLDRTIGSGVHEDYDLTNYSSETVEFDLEIRAEGDYADLFDVKGNNLVRRGSLQSKWDQQAGTHTTMYENKGFRRGLQLQVANNTDPPKFTNGNISFHIKLPPRGHWHSCLFWKPIIEGEKPSQPMYKCSALLGSNTVRDRFREQWVQQVTAIHTSDSSITSVVSRAINDLAAMRIHRHDALAAASSGDAESWVPAAGMPWFISLFGRDTLVVSLQTLALSTRFSLAGLLALAALQGDQYDDSRDMQPGKIEHELRNGELAYLKLIPQTPYYGTHDATTLYVLVAAELWRWLGDPKIMEQLRPYVEKALNWIDTDGDADGDGLQEYKTRAGAWGYFNQGWKDSGIAIVDAEGNLPELPIALCELQGYVVAAKRGWAQVLEECFNDKEGAEGMRGQAEKLAKAIEKRFWWADEGTYYLGLDAKKKPITSVSSNPGHLLWSGAILPKRAASVVSRLMAEDMWTGWGVRTLSSRHKAYNPFSYQRGSVWPHDNAILASGFRRYGHNQEAWRIARALFEAAQQFNHKRLPEVFAGLDREPGSFPVQYRGANVPQAWACGAVIHLMTTLISLEPSAYRGKLTINPALPEWLSHINLYGLRVGDSSVDLSVKRDGSKWKVNGSLEVTQA